MAIVMLMHDFMSNKDNQTVWNKHKNFAFYTVKVLVTFQNYSDSRPWIWTFDSDCYELNGVCQLLVEDYYYYSIIYTMIFDMI